MLYPGQDRTNPAELRQSYEQSALDEHSTHPDPFVQFDTWFQEALQANMKEPNAMCLSTVGAGGHPSGRMVLLKGYDARGFVFYTNYESRKGQQLADNPHCSLTFWWDVLERQVRIEGVAQKQSEEESKAYYQSRPRGSQLGAWASPQSQVVTDRNELEATFKTTAAKFEGQSVLDLPPFWGGFRVVPRLLEFWQGRPNRLHDRIVYERSDDGTWQRLRLAP